MIQFEKSNKKISSKVQGYEKNECHHYTNSKALWFEGG